MTLCRESVVKLEILNNAVGRMQFPLRMYPNRTHSACPSISVRHEITTTMNSMVAIYNSVTCTSHASHASRASPASINLRKIDKQNRRPKVPRYQVGKAVIHGVPSSLSTVRVRARVRVRVRGFG